MYPDPAPNSLASSYEREDENQVVVSVEKQQESPPPMCGSAVGRNEGGGEGRHWAGGRADGRDGAICPALKTGGGTGHLELVPLAHLAQAGLKVSL